MHKTYETSTKLYEFKTGKACSSHELLKLKANSTAHEGITVILMRELETSKKNSFVDFSKKYNPGCILDLRIASRLDVFHGSRKLSFELFDRLDIEYFDFFGRIGVNSKDQASEIELNFAEAFIYLVSADRYKSRPIVLFFDNEEILHQCSKHMENLFHLHLLPTKHLNMGELKSGLLNISSLA